MDEIEQRDIAAEKILQAMKDSVDSGAAPEVVKLVTLSAAITQFVSTVGEEATANLLESLPEKVRGGAFTQEGGEAAGNGADGESE